MVSANMPIVPKNSTRETLPGLVISKIIMGGSVGGGRG
jgi:hypothetical protein